MAMTEEREPPTDQVAPTAQEVPTGKPGPTDQPAPAAPAAVPGADLDRRNFFRFFSREAFQAAAGVVGAADAVRKGTSAAAVELLGLAADPAGGAERLAGVLEPERQAAAAGIIGGRSPYHFEGERMIVIDQRRLPGELVEISCATGVEVAVCIRDGAVGPGPVLGPLAAYAMAMAAERNVASRSFVRAATLRGTANALRSARPDSQALAAALARVQAVTDALRAEAAPVADAEGGDAVATGPEHGDGTPATGDMPRSLSAAPGPDGAAVARAIRAEADAIAMETMLALGALVEVGAAVLPQPADRPLEVVTIGATGPLSAGVVGTAIGCIAAVAAAGRPVHAWVLEARPGRSGARIGAAELRAADVPATVIADGAVGWLFGAHVIDAVLVGADRIAADGDVAGYAGTLPLAVMAARHGVPVYVCVPEATIAHGTPDGAGLPAILRGRHELLAEPGTPAVEGIDARVPLGDVTPAELVAGYVTEAGVVRPPFGPPPTEPLAEPPAGPPTATQSESAA